MIRNHPPAARPTRATRTRARLRAPLGLALLGALFAVALFAPLPTAPNTARADVMARVEDRLPGWRIVRTQSSWEGAWTVVAACGSWHVGFQFVPGHGLGPQDAWLHPEDEFTRTRLRLVSDHRKYLIWFADNGEGRERALSCQTELARAQAGRRLSGDVD
jgi:hypothetical protein